MSQGSQLQQQQTAKGPTILSSDGAAAPSSSPSLPSSSSPSSPSSSSPVVPPRVSAVNVVAQSATIAHQNGAAAAANAMAAKAQLANPFYHFALGGLLAMTASVITSATLHPIDRYITHGYNGGNPWRGYIAASAPRGRHTLGIFGFREFYSRFLRGHKWPADANVREAEVVGHYAVGGMAAVSWHYVSHPFRFHRALLLKDPFASRRPSFAYMCSHLQQVGENEGIGQVWRGALRSLPSHVIFRTIYFGGYEQARIHFSNWYENSVPTWKLLAAAQTVSTVGFMLHYPFSLVSHRMEQQYLTSYIPPDPHGLPSQRAAAAAAAATTSSQPSSASIPNTNYRSSFDCWRDILQSEGMTGLWRGAGRRGYWAIRSLADACVIVVYDSILQYSFNKQKEDAKQRALVDKTVDD